MGAVTTGFEQRKAQCILAGPKGTTRQAVAAPGDPITCRFAFDVEMIGWVDTQKDKIGHTGLRRVFRDPPQKVLIL
jgi:hypothetical protein